MKNKQLENEKDKYSRLLVEFADGLYTNLKKNTLKFEIYVISNGDIYYIYAQCNLKGIGIVKNNKKAHEILLEAIKDKNVTEKKNIFKYLIKSSKGVEMNKRKFYFEQYINLINAIKKKFSQHYYVLAKIYSKKGKFVKIDLDLAINYCKEGTNSETDLLFLIPNFYKKKCEILLKKLANAREKLTLSHDEQPKKYDEDTLCIICLEQQKEVIFIPCGHKCCCSTDGNNLFLQKNSCPVCKTEITFVLKKVYE